MARAKKDQCKGFVADKRVSKQTADDTAITGQLALALSHKLAEIPMHVPVVFEFRRTIEDAGDDLIYRVELLLKDYPRWGAGACDPPPWGDTRRLPDFSAKDVESMIGKLIRKLERNDYSPDQIAEIRSHAAEQLKLVERLRELIEMADVHTSMAHAVADDDAFGIHDDPVEEIDQSDIPF